MSTDDRNPEKLVSGVRRMPGTVAVRPEVILVSAFAVLALLALMLWMLFAKATSLIPHTDVAEAAPGGIVASAKPAEIADLGYTPKTEAIVTPAPAPTSIPDTQPTLDPAELGGTPIVGASAPTQEPVAAAPPPGVSEAPPVVQQPTESPRLAAERERAARQADEQRAAAASDLQVKLTNDPATKGGAVVAAQADNAAPAARAASRYTNPDDYDIAPGSEHVLQRGQLIPVTLYTSMDSTIAGLVTAYVNADVWDGQHAAVVVPRGAKLIGTFGSGASQGQKRIGVAWDSIKLPNGHTIVLEDFPGIDLTGTSGFGASADNHSRKLFTNVILLSILAAGAQLAQPQNQNYNGAYNAPTLGQSAAQAVGTNITNAGTQIFQRDANITPTLHVVEGAQVGVMVLHDLPLRAWRQP